MAADGARPQADGDDLEGQRAVVRGGGRHGAVGTTDHVEVLRRARVDGQASARDRVTRRRVGQRAGGEGFFHFAQRISESHRDHFLARGLDAQRTTELREMSESGLHQEVGCDFCGRSYVIAADEIAVLAEAT